MTFYCPNVAATIFMSVRLTCTAVSTAEWTEYETQELTSHEYGCFIQSNGPRTLRSSSPHTTAVVSFIRIDHVRLQNGAARHRDATARGETKIKDPIHATVSCFLVLNEIARATKGTST